MVVVEHFTTAQINAAAIQSGRIVYDTDVGALKFYNSGTVAQLTTANLVGPVGINTTNPDRVLELNSATGEVLRLTYNDSDGGAVNYVDINVTSDGDLLLDASGSDILTGTTDNFNIQSHNGTLGLQLGGVIVTATAANLNFNTGVTAGAGAASKTLVLDASRNINNINTLDTTGALTSVITSGTNSAVNYGLNLKTSFSGSSASGLGNGIQFQAQNSTPALVNIGQIRSSITATTAGSENSNLVFTTVRSGSSNIYTCIKSDFIGTTIFNNAVNTLTLLRSVDNVDGAANLATSSLNASTGLDFKAYNTVGGTNTYGRIVCSPGNVASGTYTSSFQFFVNNNGSENLGMTLSNASALTGLTNVTATTVSGTISTAAQPNITSLGIINTFSTAEGTQVTLAGPTSISAGGYLTSFGGRNVATLPFLISNSNGLNYVRYSRNANSDVLNPYNQIAEFKYIQTGALNYTTLTDTFGYELAGFINPQFSESYTLSITTTNMFYRFWLDGMLVSQNWNDVANGTKQVVTVAIAALRKHIHIQLLPKAATGTLFQVQWNSTSQSIVDIPGSRLFTEDVNTAVLSKALSVPKQFAIYDIHTTSASIIKSELSLSTSGNLTINSSGLTTLIDATNNLDIAGHNGTTLGLKLAGTLITASAVQLNYNAGITLGTVTASKTVTVDASSNVTGFNSLTSTTLVATTLNVDSTINLTADNATGNTTLYPFNILRTTSGTPANNLGIGIKFDIENSNNDNTTFGSIEISAQDITDTTEDGQLITKLMRAGTLTTAFSSDSLGVFSATSFAETSDIRTKNIIGDADADESLNKIMEIEIKDYTMKNDITERKHRGFIAQDLYNIIPDAVHIFEKDEISDFHAVETKELIGYLIQSVQVLKKEIDILKNNYEI